MPYKDKDTRNAWQRKHYVKRGYDPAYYAVHKDRIRTYQRQYYKDNDGRAQSKARARQPASKCKRLQRKYGITLIQRDALLASQGGCCGICQAETPGDRRDWDVDHCHTSGAVRGVLCQNCNLMLGHARDNSATLSAAITYLERFENGGQKDTTH